MKTIESVVVGLDGAAKCGKTAISNSIATEARYFSDDLIPNTVANFINQGLDLGDAFVPVMEWGQQIKFNSVNEISAGNSFRAATLYLALLELRGEKKTAFTDADYDGVKDMLEMEGITQILQTDPNVKRLVTPTGKMPGAQALCGALFTDTFMDLYRANPHSLFIADARDPVGHFVRNGVVGYSDGKIKPESIMPLYIETPAEAAAAWQSGNYEEELALILSRRETDETRTDLPVKRPDNLVESYTDWIRQFPELLGTGQIARPFHFRNGEGVLLGNIQWVAGHIALDAQELGVYLHS